MNRLTVSSIQTVLCRTSERQEFLTGKMQKRLLFFIFLSGFCCGQVIFSAVSAVPNDGLQSISLTLDAQTEGVGLRNFELLNEGDNAIIALDSVSLSQSSGTQFTLSFPPKLALPGSYRFSVME